MKKVISLMTLFAVIINLYCCTYAEGQAGTNTACFILNDVTYGNSLFVAVGINGVINISKDGLNWRQVSSGLIYDLNRVIWGNNMFVAVGERGVILTSPDGEKWTSVKSRIIYENDLYDVVRGKDKFVAAGDGVTIVSSDGINWTAQRVESYTKRILYNGEVYVAVSDSGEKFVSNDGIGWERINTSGFMGIIDAQWNGKQFIVLGYMTIGYKPKGSRRFMPYTYPIINTSTDGLKWSEICPEGNKIKEIKHTSQGFFAYGDNGSSVQLPDCDIWMKSRNQQGVNGTYITKLNSEKYTIFGIAHNETKYVCVGLGASGLSSEYGGSYRETGFIGVSTDRLNWTTTTQGNSLPTLKVKVNGKLVTSDVPAGFEDNRVLLPLRPVLEALGAKVRMDEKTQAVIAWLNGMILSVEYDGEFSRMWEPYIEGRKVGMRLGGDDPYTRFVNDRMMVSVPFIVQWLGVKAELDLSSMTVNIWRK